MLKKKKKFGKSNMKAIVFPLLLIMVFINFVSISLLLGDELTVDELLKKMQKYEAEIKDLQFEFIQEIEFTTVQEKYITESRLIFKKPKKIFYEQYEPRKIVIVSNGKKMYLYNPVNKQVFIDKWKTWKGIDYFLPGLFHPKGKISYLKKNYDFEIYGKENNAYVLHISPKKKLKKSKHIPSGFEFYLWVDEEKYYPKKSKFVSENVICITEIKNWQINLNPDKKLFKFKIPDDVEVLRLK